MRKVKLLHVFVLSFFISFFAVSPVVACTPAPITPWFVEKFELLNETLPDGIIFVQWDWTDAPYSSYSIRNDSYKKIQIIGIDGTVIKESTDEHVIFLSDYPDYYANIYEIDAKNIMSDNRPEFVPIPDSQYVEIPVKIDDEFFLLEILITYEMNDSYRPSSVYDFTNGCRLWAKNNFKPQFNFLFPYIAIGISIIVIAIIVLYKIWTKRFKETKK